MYEYRTYKVLEFIIKEVSNYIFFKQQLGWVR